MTNTEWKEYKLSELLTIKYGKNQKAVEDPNGRIPIYGTGGLMGFASRPLYDKPSILIGRKGSIEKVRYVDHPFWTVDTLFYSEINKEIVLPKFLYYSMSLTNFSNYNEGTTIPSLRTETLNRLIYRIPSFKIQEKIVQILSSLDDKIELNNAINRNLEEQAQAIFKSWFVDFEPFGEKRPSDWKKTNIYNIANIIYGAPFSSKLFNMEKNGKPIYRIRDLKDQHSDVYTPENIEDAYLIQPKDIVVGMDGEFRPYLWGGEPGWLNQRVCVFENKRPKGKTFLYFTIKPLLDKVEKTQVATTVIHIGKKDFDKFEILLPSNDVLDKFDELTNPIFDQIVSKRLESKHLANLRDSLLPKLMSNELGC